MKLILPFPPSVNTYWRHPNKGAFAGKSLISAAGRKFQSAACAAIVEQLRRLSGLQRIEYLAFVQQRTAKFDAEEGELPEAERQIAFLRMGMDINAWLVSRSLWNAEQSQDVETLCASVITTWSYDALGAGAEMVLSLSGMGAIENAGDLEHEVLTPEKS